MQYPQNLDAMTPEELDAVAADESAPGRTADYARAKAKAIRFRIAGEISTALLAEERCDLIYETTPDELRW